MADSPIAERTMSDAEGLMWRLERDPYLSSTFGTLVVLDRAPDFDRLRARMDRTVVTFPHLGWRVQPSPGEVAPPRWVDDPDFDLDFHVRRIALAKPGTRRDLLDLASLIVLDGFERTRPLWQFVIVEGLPGGKAALIQKMHHTITDGQGGIRLAEQYLDLERDPTDPPPAASPAETPAPPPPTAADTVRELVNASFRMPLGMARQVRDLLADPTALPSAGAAAIEAVRGIVHQLTDVDKAKSPLWTARSMSRRLEVARAPFRPTRDAARRLGGTLNTAFLTAAADAAGRYHAEFGAPVDALRASMAVSTRTASSGANAFTLARFLVPTGDMPIADRFRAIHEATIAAREEAAGGSLSTLASVVATMPTSVVGRLVRQQSQTIDFATSNVAGSPVPVYLAGAKMLETYPIGPLAGVAFNLTLLSYAGHLDMGLNVDKAAVGHPERLAQLLEQAFASLTKTR